MIVRVLLARERSSDHSADDRRHTQGTEGSSPGREGHLSSAENPISLSRPTGLALLPLGQRIGGSGIRADPPLVGDPTPSQLEPLLEGKGGGARALGGPLARGLFG